ncbi:hypothetical protein XANCAGTX0491_005206 [Xanthoria calcicola]
MHEGLAHDDIYIMVEDEFLSAAQLFTSHLHHAEYVRLKNAAKARNGSNITARPTDSITAMRAETKKKKEAEVRTGKNRAALDKMMSDTRANIALSSDEEQSEDEDEEDDQPWAGTSLQGLMAPAARKNLTSLSGLQGIQSSTRAANGYAKPDDASQSNRAHEIFKPPQPQPQPAPPRTHIPPNPPPTSKHHPPTLRSLSSSDSSSDDLDAPSTRPPRTAPKNHTSSQPPPKPNPSNPLTLAAEDLFHEKKSYHGPKASLPQQQTQTRTHNHKLPGSSPPSRNDEVAAARRRLEQRRERAAAKKTNESTNGNGNVNEIPVFLV